MSVVRRKSRPIPGLAFCLLTLIALGAPDLIVAQGPVTEADESQAISGRVVIGTTDQPVPAAEVTLVELDRRTITDAEGHFVFADVPRGSFTLGVHASSFSSLHLAVEVPATGLRVALEPDRHFTEEVTVTAAPWATRPHETSQAVSQVDQETIQAAGNNSIGEALAHVPGVANIGTGDALGTPVIRGISENRIRIMNDGVPVNHQQWSSRHSPNVEPALAERIEVVRGPASVMWGPDAMGGVINVVQSPLPSAAPGESSLHGEVGVGYFTNQGQGQGQVVLEGAKGGFGWRVGAVRRDAGDIDTPQGTLDNTDYQQTNGTVTAGYTGSWGTAKVRWLHWENDVGFFFPEGSPSDGFRLRLDDDTFAGELLLPISAGDIDVLLSHQENVREAFNPAAPVYPEAALDLKLTTTVGRVGLNHRRLGAWKGKLSVEYRGVDNTTRKSHLLPNYDVTDYSLMVFEEGRFLPTSDGAFKRLILSFGLRGDQSTLRVPVDPSQPVVPAGFDRRYSSVSGSIGLVYRIAEEFSVAANLGRGWRPPSPFELFARGVHGGVAAFQVGNPDLVEESNVSGEISLRYLSSHWRAELTGYRSEFSDFIYLFDTGEIAPGTDLPIFGYTQSDATNDGIEASIDLVPLEQLEFGIVYSSVNTWNQATGNHLPQSPADRFSFRVRTRRPLLGPLLSPFAELETEWVGEGVPSGPDEPYFASGNAATDSYNLLHLKIGCKVAAWTGAVALDLTVRNLLDEEYTDFLYPYKGFGVPNAGRDVRLVGRFLF